MKNVISMDAYMAAKRTTESMARIAAEFIDQNGWTLKEGERRRDDTPGFRYRCIRATSLMWLTIIQPIATV